MATMEDLHKLQVELAAHRLISERLQEYMNRVAEDFEKANTAGGSSFEALRIATDHSFRLSLLTALWELRYALKPPEPADDGVGGMKR